MQKQGASGKDQVAIVDYKISQLKALNANVYNRVKNPYLQLFFRVMIEGKNQGFMANPPRQFIDKHVINLFDFVAICCKFLDDLQLKQVLEAKIKSDIDRGNLQVFALIGLKSEHAPRVIQNYIDNTGDLQTAAYISTYIATVCASPAI